MSTTSTIMSQPSERNTPARLKPSYTYEEALSASVRVNWRLEDIIGGEKRLDFEKPFMPEALARVEQLSFLSGRERTVLNQIRGNGYLYIFGVVEEFILPFVLDHARPHLRGDDYRVRALLQFASEEAKHIQLFKRFREEFEAGFGNACGVIGPPQEISRAVLAHHPLAVVLAILHIEWMTQRHYIDSVQDNRALDPQFRSLLKHHWMEEAQHAKLDTLMVQAITEACSEEEIGKAIDEYLEIGGMLDSGLMQQVQFDLESLSRTIGRKLNEEETRQFIEVQSQATRWTFLGSGMSHPNFLGTMEALRPGTKDRLEPIVRQFS
jgi:hypothetical protein